LEIPVLLCKFVFTNKGGFTGEMYLVSNINKRKRGKLC
jgi:hypothetical protein